MSNKSADGHQHAVERFWHNYLSILEKNAIPQRSRKWYRRHVELYIAAHGEVRLAQHLTSHVDKYLTAKGRLSDLDERRLWDGSDHLVSDIFTGQFIRFITLSGVTSRHMYLIEGLQHDLAVLLICNLLNRMLSGPIVYQVHIMPPGNCGRMGVYGIHKRLLPIMSLVIQEIISNFLGQRERGFTTAH